MTTPTDAPVPMLLTLDAVSRRLAVSRRQIERLTAAHEIASVRIGRRRLIDERALREYMDRLASTPSAAR